MNAATINCCCTAAVFSAIASERETQFSEPIAGLNNTLQAIPLIAATNSLIAFSVGFLHGAAKPNAIGTTLREGGSIQQMRATGTANKRFARENEFDPIAQFRSWNIHRESGKLSLVSCQF